MADIFDKVIKKQDIFDKVSAKQDIFDKVSSRVPFLGSTTNFQEMTPLGKTLDVLARPGYAVKSGIKHGIEGQDIGQGMVEGFTGQDRVLANDLWAKAGVSGVPGLGFASEIVLDPLSYAGGAIGKGFGLAGKAISKIPVPAKAEKVINGLKTAFVTKSVLKNLETGVGLADLVDKHLLERGYLSGKEMKFSIKARNIISDVAAKTKQPIENIEAELINMIELPGYASKYPELGSLASIMKDHFSDILSRELKAGVPISELAKNTRGIEYFPRIATKEVIEYLNKAKIGKARVWDAKLENALQRRTQDFTLAEFNQFAKEHGLDSLAGKHFENFFLPKAEEALFIRGVRSARAVTSAEFISDAAKNFGKKASDAPYWYEQLPDNVINSLPGFKLEGFKFDPEVLREITRVSQRYFNSQKAIPYFDAATNLWKRWSLSIFPKYHLRNEIGNLWNNYLADVNPMRYNDAAAIQMWRKYRKTGGVGEKTALSHLDAIKLSPEKADDIIDRAERLGVLNMGWFSKDIEEPVATTLKHQRGPVAKGMAVGSTFENNSRLAHFLDKTRNGMDDYSAALSVKKYLFDYSDLTNFEQQILKRVFPFYTWTRKNIPLQIDSMLTKPQKYVPLAYPLRSRNEEDLKKVREAAPWLYERMPMEVGGGSSKTYLPMEGFLPAADVGKLWRPSTGRSRTPFEKYVPGGEIMTELLHPIPKVLLDLAYNRKMFTEQDLERYPGETQSILGFDLPVALQHIVLSATPISRGLREVDTMTRKKKDGEELTFREKLIQGLLGSVYKVSLEDLREKSLRNIKRDIQDLKFGYKQAQKRERKNEMQRIEKTLQELQKVVQEVDK